MSRVLAYYNEIDPFAAQWLRNLISAGHIASGHVDERSISDIRPSDLVGYTQHHFFAGIGGWSYALRLAGWDDSRPVWTGSCPCQPFSQAGSGKGTSDERHLWPHWFHLIRALRPPVIFGEQVEAAIKHGWLDLVQDDLEGEGYSFAAAGLPAACVSAPHVRQRLWFVGDTAEEPRQRHTRAIHGEKERESSSRSLDGVDVIGSEPSSSGVLRRRMDNNNNNQGSQGRTLVRERPSEQSPWSPGLVDWLPCTDGKWRPVEAGTFPLAHGVRNRVGLLRGYGNAIVPQVAAEFIRAYLECRPC